MIEDYRRKSCQKEELSAPSLQNYYTFCCQNIKIPHTLIRLRYRQLQRSEQIFLSGESEFSDKIPTIPVYSDLSGNVIWNQTYEMETPRITLCEEYLAIYEQGGTRI